MSTPTTITVAELKALRLFTRKDHRCPQLACIAVYDSGTLAASDGHTLVVRGEIPDRHARHSLIREDALDRLCALPRKTDITVSRHGVSHVEGAIRDDWTFPPIAAVVPARTRETDPCIGIDVSYMDRMHKISRACGGKLSHWRMMAGSALDPVRFEKRSGSVDWTVIIMPVRL